MPQIQHADRVEAALVALTTETAPPERLLFVPWFRTSQIAERAGVSLSCARYHLMELVRYNPSFQVQLVDKGLAYGFRFEPTNRSNHHGY